MTPELHCCYRLFYTEGDTDNKKVHVRGFVDNKIIVRYWENVKWAYSVTNQQWWSDNAKYLTKVKR